MESVARATEQVHTPVAIERRGMKLVLVIVAGLATAAVAAAGVVGGAQVGVPGRNETRGYSPALSVVLASPAAYRKGCCTDVDSGQWLGPRYQASDNPSLNGPSSIDWSVHFDTADSSALAAVKANLVHSYPVAKTLAVAVPHLIGKVRVDTIAGTAATTTAPGTASAQVEGGIAFRLCRGLFAVADFDLLKPYAEQTGTGGTFTVEQTGAKEWNASQLLAALHGVSLAGYLPVTHVAARSSGTDISGVVTDCAASPMPGVRVRVGTHTVVTDAHGAYRAPGASGTDVVVTAGGATVHARAA
jgi:hypothetical protein